MMEHTIDQYLQLSAYFVIVEWDNQEARRLANTLRKEVRLCLYMRRLMLFSLP